jgi:uncharacterized protein (TIGR01777 family)
MVIGITGSSGLVGSAVGRTLAEAGHRVVPICRKNGTSRGLPMVAQDGDASFDAVVHLAGEPIASGRWSAAKKARIRESRVLGTSALCRQLTQQDRPPRTIVCASAIGFYGNRGDELLDEDSRPGTGFLPEVVRAWEEAATGARSAGIRVVHLRFGMILSRQGGALATMLFPFQWGLGGRIGNGHQYWSWIALDDALAAIHHALATEDLSGPVNAVAPQCVTNAEFTATLAGVLRRPHAAALPAWIAHIMLGQMADELLLASARATPRRLLESGFAFRHARLEAALRHLLDRPD